MEVALRIVLSVCPVLQRCGEEGEMLLAGHHGERSEVGLAGSFFAGFALVLRLGLLLCSSSQKTKRLVVEKLRNVVIHE